MQRSGMRGLVAPIIPGSASSTRATLADSRAESAVRVVGWIRRAAGAADGIQGWSAPHPPIRETRGKAGSVDALRLSTLQRRGGPAGRVSINKKPTSGEGLPQLTALEVTNQRVARMQQREMRGMVAPIIPGSARSTRATLAVAPPNP